MTTDPPFAVRTLTTADIDDILALDTLAFGYDPPRDFFDEVAVPQFEMDRFTGIFDPELGGELVGQGNFFSKRMTFPGGQVHPVAAVSWVAVRPGQQRRGILRTLMRTQLDTLHERPAEPIAILTASEAAIYGRFGYGPAAFRLRLEAPGGAAFRPGIHTERVRQLAKPDAAAQLRAIYERVAPTITGALGRTDAVWAERLSDHAELRGGASHLHVAVHPDGYATYRLKQQWNDRGADYALVINEILAATPLAHASLWRHLLDVALVRTVSHRQAWVDDPVQDLLADQRQLIRPVGDHLWLRLVDLPRAIGLRGYSAPADITVELTDTFCPWNEGTWRLELGPDGGRATRAAAGEAQVHLDTADLASAFLGGIRIARLASAGLVTGDRSAIDALDAALSTPLAPWCPEGF